VVVLADAAARLGGAGTRNGVHRQYVESGATRAGGVARRGVAKTAPAMSQTPPEVLKSSTIAAELADRLTISREQDAFRLELRGQSGNGAAGMVKREELQRILQMLHGVVAQAGWLAAPGAGRPAAAAMPSESKPARH